MSTQSVREALSIALNQLEEWEVRIDGEWGLCRDLAELERDGKLSSATLAARAALAEPAVQVPAIPEGAMLKFMATLHSNVPEVDRPMSRSDFSDEQWARIEAAFGTLAEPASRAALATPPTPSPEMLALRELVAVKRLRARADAISPVEPGCEKEVLLDEWRRRDRIAWAPAFALVDTNPEPK